MSSKSAPLDPRVRLDGTGRSALEQAAEAGRHPTPRGAQHPATTAATTAKPPTSAAALKATALRVVSIPVDDIERHDPLVIVLPEGMQMDVRDWPEGEDEPPDLPKK